MVKRAKEGQGRLGNSGALKAGEFGVGIRRFSLNCLCKRKTIFSVVSKGF